MLARPPFVVAKSRMPFFELISLIFVQEVPYRFAEALVVLARSNHCAQLRVTWLIIAPHRGVPEDAIDFAVSPGRFIIHPYCGKP